jgi:hypothetical protein
MMPFKPILTTNEQRFVPEHAVWPARHVYAPPGVEIRLALRLMSLQLDGPGILLHFVTAERDTGEPVSFTTRYRLTDDDVKLLLTYNAPDRAVVINRALLFALAHEVAESIKVDGVRWLDPHAHSDDEGRHGY